MRETELAYDHEGNKSASFETPLKDIKKTLPMRVLSDADWEHWTTRGYVVVTNAVPPDHIERLKSLLWEFEEKDPDDPATWNRGDRRSHQMKELGNTGMVEIYNHQYLWDNRQHPRVYDAFVDIWDREDLWVTIDRANLNTPNRGGRQFDGFIHWDVDSTADPLPVNVQGVLSLVDTDPEVGGFQCVPDLFRNFEEWTLTQPSNRDPFHPNVSDFNLEFVPLKAGDLLIWNSLLAHGIKPNRSPDRARMAQYISMYPADETNEALRRQRITSWREREAPRGVAFPGDPREWEKTRYETARLTELGKRLLGYNLWNE